MALTTEEKAKRFDVQQEKGRRYSAKLQLLITKARATGITVTDAEVDKYIKEREGK